MFSRVLYSGYIEHEPWGITRRKGHHAALITSETFQRIRDRKAFLRIAPARRHIHQDFPLCGAVSCSDCKVPQTTCWSRGGMCKRYLYFCCQTKTCKMYRENIRAEKIDVAFEEMMQSVTPTKGLIGVVKAMLTDAWAHGSNKQIASKHPSNAILQSGIAS